MRSAFWFVATIVVLAAPAVGSLVPRLHPEDARYEAALEAQGRGDAKEALGYLRPLREELEVGFEEERQNFPPTDPRVVASHFELLAALRLELVLEFENRAPKERLEGIARKLLSVDPVAPLARADVPPPVREVVERLRAEVAPPRWRHVPRLWATEDKAVRIAAWPAEGSNLRELWVLYKREPGNEEERVTRSRLKPCSDVSSDCESAAWVGEIPASMATKNGPIFYSFEGNTFGERMVGADRWYAVWIVDSVLEIQPIVPHLESIVHDPEGIDFLTRVPLFRTWSHGDGALGSEFEGVDWEARP